MERRYLGSSAVLETTFTTATGVVTLTDLMPRSDGRADVVRRLHGVSGTVPMRHEWVIRLDYGDVVPWVQREVICGERVITAIGGPDKLILRGPRLPVAGDHRHVDEFEVSAGDELLFSTTWVPSHVLLDDLGSLEDRIGATTDADDEWVAAVPDRPPARGRRTPLAADPADAHPRGHRRHRRRPDHLAAGGVRRRAQLGLPLLLAARRGPDAGLPHRGRLHRGGAAVARLAAAGGGRRPRGPADHVRRGRRPAAAGGRPGPPARLRGIPPGPDRQRGRRAAPVGRPRGGHDRPRARPRRRPGARRPRLGDATGAGPEPGQGVARARQRPVGDPRPAAPLHPLPGHGLGRLRPRGARRRAARPAGAGRGVAPDPRRGARRGPRARLRPGAQQLHPALRHHRGRRLAAGAVADRVRRRATTPGCSAPSPPSRRT